MSRPRKFDWNEARRLRAQGLTYAEIGRRLGVSDYAIKYACSDATARQAISGRSNHRGLTCADCGREVTGSIRRRCLRCAGLAQATSVRPDELHCHRCSEWKPDGMFPHDAGTRLARRGRHRVCRACQAGVKREWRERHSATCERCEAHAARTAGEARSPADCARVPA